MGFLDTELDISHSVTLASAPDKAWDHLMNRWEDSYPNPEEHIAFEEGARIHRKFGACSLVAVVQELLPGQLLSVKIDCSESDFSIPLPPSAAFLTIGLISQESGETTLDFAATVTVNRAVKALGATTLDRVIKNQLCQFKNEIAANPTASTAISAAA